MIQNSTEEDQWVMKKVEFFCGLAAPNGLHFALPQHLRSFLLLLLTSIAGMSTECKRLASGSEYAGRISRTTVASNVSHGALNSRISTTSGYV